MVIETDRLLSVLNSNLNKMPLLVKDYTWSETKDTVFVNVPLKGVRASKVDLFCTSTFLKASYPPFLFEALLYDEVDDDKSVAKVTDGCVIFHLKKVEEKLWNQLLSSRSDDKKFVLQKKQEAIEIAQKQAEEKDKQKSKVKAENKKYALHEMMKLEEGARSRIENLKENERIETEKEMEHWKTYKMEEELKERIKIEREKHKNHRNKVENNIIEVRNKENIFDDEDIPKIYEIEDDTKLPKKQSHQNGQSDKTKLDHNHSKTCNNIPPLAKSTKPLEKPKYGPRAPGKIGFKFTPRVFPTPQRESKIAEEDEWLKRQAEARKICEIDDPDLKEHEKDPVWLKDKGNQLFKSGNFQAAINAFNLAIRLQPKQPVLFLNRSACHLKLRNLYKCIEDASNALELMSPPVDANAKGRVKGHIRRGTAFCELELYAEGLQDYMAASKIDPNNEGLKADCEKIKEIIEKGS